SKDDGKKPVVPIDPPGPAPDPGTVHEWDGEQISIIHAPPDARLLVDAGPGTGKTAVACGRVAHLIDQARLSPSRICIISFTRIAVQEIQARIRRYLRRPDDG